MPRLSLVTVLVLTFVLPAYAQENELSALELAAKELPKDTKAGQMVADLSMARSMIDFGRRTKNPEIMLLAVEILHKTPVETVKGEDNASQDLDKIVVEAVEMRPDDESLLQLAERVQEALEEKTRGLAGGPKQWVVEIKPKEYYQLDPRLIYNAHEKAIIAAESADPGVVLGASVRRSDIRKETTRGVGKGKVHVQWNAGLHTSGWDVRVYNLTGKTPVKVRVTTN